MPAPASRCNQSLSSLLFAARFGVGVGHADSQNKKVALRHRQHLGGRAGQELAVGAHLVGFRDRPRSAASRSLCIMLFLEMPPRVFCDGDELLLDAELFAAARPLTAAFETNTTEDAVSALPKAPNIGR